MYKPNTAQHQAALRLLEHIEVIRNLHPLVNQAARAADPTIDIWIPNIARNLESILDNLWKIYDYIRTNKISNAEGSNFYIKGRAQNSTWDKAEKPVPYNNPPITTVAMTYNDIPHKLIALMYKLNKTGEITGYFRPKLVPAIQTTFNHIGMFIHHYYPEQQNPVSPVKRIRLEDIPKYVVTPPKTPSPERYKLEHELARIKRKLKQLDDIELAKRQEERERWHDKQLAKDGLEKLKLPDFHDKDK